MFRRDIYDASEISVRMYVYVPSTNTTIISVLGNLKKIKTINIYRNSRRK